MGNSSFIQIHFILRIVKQHFLQWMNNKNNLYLLFLNTIKWKSVCLLWWSQCIFLTLLPCFILCFHWRLSLKRALGEPGLSNRQAYFLQGKEMSGTCLPGWLQWLFSDNLMISLYSMKAAFLNPPLSWTLFRPNPELCLSVNRTYLLSSSMYFAAFMNGVRLYDHYKSFLCRS